VRNAHARLPDNLSSHQNLKQQQKIKPSGTTAVKTVMNYEHDDDSIRQSSRTTPSSVSFGKMETDKRHQPTIYIPESMNETNIERQQPSLSAKKAKMMMANNFRGHFENRPILKAVEECYENGKEKKKKLRSIIL
jgi:hypothetical protein